MRVLAPLLTILLALPASAASVLRLQSQGGVEVFWEGVALGKTNTEGLLVIEGIPPGEYLLTLRKQGFHDLKPQIEMVEGAALSRDVFLTSINVPASDAPESIADPPDPRLLAGMGLLMTLLAGAAGAWYLSSRRKASAPPRNPPRETVRSRSRDDEAPLFEETEHGSPAFLEDLKRREQDFDDPAATPSKRPEETIIELEAVEVTTDRPATRR